MTTIEHVAVDGETWDRLALKYYYSEFELGRLLKANPDLSDVLVFSGGEHIVVPVVSENELTSDSAAIPPWRR